MCDLSLGDVGYVRIMFEDYGLVYIRFLGIFYCY